MIIHKFYSDYHYSSQAFSEVTGLDQNTLNSWEFYILQSLDYKIIINETDIFSKISHSKNMRP